MQESFRLFTGAPYGRYDKLVHFFASAAVTVVVLTVLPLLPAVAVSVSAGALKEILDRTVRGARFDWADFFADVLGVAVVTLLYAGLRRFLAS